jgi:Bardet-Biedl syndrome 2 protein
MGNGRNETTLSFDSDVSLLNINAVVTSLSTGILDASSKNDSLLIGTSTSVLAYDVNNNTDLFYKEVN